jgi:hypothetical protein
MEVKTKKIIFKNLIAIKPNKIAKKILLLKITFFNLTRLIKIKHLPITPAFFLSNLSLTFNKNQINKLFKTITRIKTYITFLKVLKINSLKQDSNLKP